MGEGQRLRHTHRKGLLPRRRDAMMGGMVVTASREVERKDGDGPHQQKVLTPIQLSTPLTKPLHPPHAAATSGVARTTPAACIPEQQASAAGKGKGREKYDKYPSQNSVVDM